LQLAFVAVNGHMAICRAVFVCRRTRSDADGIVIRIISGNGAHRGSVPDLAKSLA